MSTLAYGLNITKKPQRGQRPPPAKRKTIFDDDSDPEDGPDKDDPSESISTIGGLQPPSKPGTTSISDPPNGDSLSHPSKGPKISPFGSLSSNHTSSKHSKTAQNIDPSIYDYDSFYTSTHSVPSGSPSEETTSSGSKRPKYMTNLLAAAEVRKRDQLRAKEKMLAKEREAEGDDFADKEKFVTGAYKRQQEEMRKLEAQEAEKEKKDEERARREGGGMKAFYKEMLGREEQRHEAITKAAEEGVGKKGVDGGKGDAHPDNKKEEKSEADLAREKGALLNEEGEVVDKRQLLSAGLNPGGAAKARPKAVDPRDRGRVGRGRDKRQDESKAFEDELLGLRSLSPQGDGADSRAAKSRKMEDELLAAMDSP